MASTVAPAAAISVLALPAIFAITLHEAAHGFVAYRCGDDTACAQGRVTFNPLRHIDPFGTILMPLLLFLVSSGRFLFGYAKPVPVNFARLRHPRRDMVLGGAGGTRRPIIALALVSAALLLRAHRRSCRRWHDAAWVGANLLRLGPRSTSSSRSST